MIVAEDDQEFLSKLQLTLNRASSPSKMDETGTPTITRASNAGGVSGSQTPSIGTRPRAQPVRIFLLPLKFFFESNEIFFQSGGATGAGAATNEGALANFFNSLLTRKSGGAVTPTSTGATSNVQRPSESKFFSFLFCPFVGSLIVRV